MKKIEERNALVAIVLGLITCGIYTIFFMRSLSKDMNVVCEGDGQDTKDYFIVWLLGLVTLGIYPIFWYYKLANRQQDTGASKYGVEIKEGGQAILLWMVIGMFVGFGALVGTYFIVQNMNTLAAAYNAKLDGSGAVVNDAQA